MKPIDQGLKQTFPRAEMFTARPLPTYVNLLLDHLVLTRSILYCNLQVMYFRVFLSVPECCAVRLAHFGHFPVSKRASRRAQTTYSRLPPHGSTKCRRQRIPRLSLNHEGAWPTAVGRRTSLEVCRLLTGIDIDSCNADTLCYLLRVGKRV